MSTATGATAPKVMMAAPPAGVAVVPDVYAKEAMIAWFRGEFAAANAIIDTLCDHIAQVSGGATTAVADYEPVFAAIQRRRANWMPVLHMQKYYSIGEVVFQLRAVAEKRKMAAEVEVEKKKEEEDVVEEEVVETAAAKVVVQEEEDSSVESTSLDQINSVDANGSCGGGGGDGSDVIGSTQEEQSSVESTQTCSDNNVQICSDHEVCTARPERIKTCKGFSAKEPVKGHMMNVVKGLKMFEDIFVESELSKLAEFISELRAAGRNGELAGETFIFFNKQLKGNKREIIQLGVPIFQSTKEATSTIEPIPSILQNVIDHLVQWRLIPESRKPNSCFINFFDEGDFSQPYFKPPHLDNPISTLFLYETTMAFGRVLVSDHEGNYKGSLTLPIKEGSLVVMRGNSADMARHVVCPSPNTRVCITFLKVRPPKNTLDSSSPTTPPPLTTAMTLWKPESAIPQAVGYAPQAMSPTWGGMALQSPLVMLAPPRPMVMNPTRKANRNNGTGVFLPWSVGPKKYVKHLPPRIQRRRLHSLALPPPLKVQVEKASQVPCIAV